MKRKFSKILGVGLTLVLLASMLVMATPVAAADGSGSCTVAPLEVVAGSTGNELTFTFTATETMDLGEITIEMPALWSAPQGTGGVAGYTTADTTGAIGTITFAAQVVTIPITTLAGTQTITVVYGDGGGAGGAAAQTTAETVTFVTSSKLSGGTLEPIMASPEVTVKPDMIDHYTATAIPDPQVADTAFDVTIQAQDANNNNITSGPDAAENIAITFAQADAGATPTIANTTAGTVTVSMTMTVAQAGQSITFTGASGAAVTSNSFAVDPTAIDHYSVTAIADPQLAGTGFAVTIQAQDANDNDIVTGSETITIDFGLADAGATPVTATTTDGTVTIAAMTMTVAQEGQTITFIGDTSGVSGTSNSFDINAGAIHHYSVTAITDPQVTDMAFDVTIQAQDANNNDITSGADEVVNITVGQVDVGLDPISTTTVDGTKTVSITLTVAQEDQTIIFTGVSTKTGTSNSFTVNHPGAIHHYSVTEITSPKEAGTGFAVTIQAQDANDNDIVTGSETITIDFGLADAGATPVTATTTDGTVTIAAMTMTVAQAGQSITFTGDVSGASGTSNSFDVDPGALAHYSVTAVADPQLAGTAFDVTIQAQDANNNDITSGADEVVNITVGEVDAGLDPTATATVDGTVTVSVLLTVVQDGQTVIFTGVSTKTGTSNVFDVDQPGAIHHYAVTTTIDPKAINVAFDVTIQAQDADNNNIVSGSEAAEAITIDFGLTDAGATPVTTTTSDGTKTVSMTMTVAQAGQSITFTGDVSGASGTLNSFTVYDAIMPLQPDAWALISTPLWISSDSAWIGETPLLYKAAGSVFSSEVTLAEDLEPVEALYVKMGSDGGSLGLIFSTGVQGLSSKELEAGWNLISSADNDLAKAVLSGLRDVANDGTGITTIANQGAYNLADPPVLGFYEDTTDWSAFANPEMKASFGYWVHMNAAKTFGVVPLQ